MEAQRIEDFQISNSVAHNITQDELQQEFDYYKVHQPICTKHDSIRWQI